MSQKWAGRLYEGSLKDDKFPPKVKKELEEDLYKYEGPVPLIVENPHWPKAKARITIERAYKEGEEEVDRPEAGRVARCKEAGQSTNHGEKPG